MNKTLKLLTENPEHGFTTKEIQERLNKSRLSVYQDIFQNKDKVTKVRILKTDETKTCYGLYYMIKK